MQVTIDQIIQLINPSREVGDAFAAAKNTAADVGGVVSAAMAWLEQQYDTVSPIGAENIFGVVQTAETWSADRNRYNAALVEVARVGKILGVLV
mgnify:CR=1 FL=1